MPLRFQLGNLTAMYARAKATARSSLFIFIGPQWPRHCRQPEEESYCKDRIFCRKERQEITEFPVPCHFVCVFKRNTSKHITVFCCCLLLMLLYHLPYAWLQPFLMWSSPPVIRSVPSLNVRSTNHTHQVAKLNYIVSTAQTKCTREFAARS